MTTPGAITGLNCPNCGSPLSIPEGQRIVVCPACEMRSLVAGERGEYRYQVPRRVDRAQAETTLRGFFSGLNKAADLGRAAQVRELFLVYLPYWRARAQVAGWLFGKVRRGSGKDSRLVPVEVEIAEEMTWSDAACDVAEFGVQRVRIPAEELAPYAPDGLRAEGMVFEPVESASEALDQAHDDFLRQARAKKSLSQKSFEMFKFLEEQLAVVFYPLWVARYEYRKRMYQAVIDGARPRVLFGKAPGNIVYRAAMLVLGLAAGNCLLVNGTLIALSVLSSSSNNRGDNSFLIVCVPAVIGLAILYAGYRLFRYGEEVVHRDRETLAPGKAGPGLAGASEEIETALDVIGQLSGRR